MVTISDSIIYQDTSIIALNKPAGLLTITDGYVQEKENLYQLLKKEFKEVLVVHRLDKETSGVIIFAFTQKAHKFLNIQFQNRMIIKKYVAITHNIPNWDEYEAKLSIKINGDRKHRTIVSQSGKSSFTFFKRGDIDLSKNISIVYAFPKSGYTHQIRAHLSYLGHPILGDSLYNKNLNSQQLILNQNQSRIMLHAESIEFIHPELEEKMILSVPIPFLLNKF